jgi:Dephospho-CoA kinase
MKIGVTGKMESGKTTLIDYLASKGFEKLSLSDLIREEAAKMRMDLTRRNLQDLGSKMRKTHGLGIWASLAAAKMVPGGDYVIDSIRNPGEIKILADSGNFVLIAVDSRVETRFARTLRERSKDGGEPRTLTDFKASEARELGSKDLSRQQLVECVKMADFTISNDSDKESFFREIDAVLE